MSQTQTQTTVNPKLSTSFGGTIEKDIPTDVVWIDDAFYIKETRFGLYTSILKEPLGQHFLTGATKDGVINMTHKNYEDYAQIFVDNRSQLTDEIIKKFPNHWEYLNGVYNGIL